jgi:hypothetical protein
VVNRAATALRLAATTLLRSQSYLGAQYRRLRGKLGAPKAITAMAHKLARLVYRLLRWGHAYVDKGQQYSDTASNSCNDSSSGPRSWDCSSSYPTSPSLFEWFLERGKKPR